MSKKTNDKIVKDGRTKDQRRADRLALREKAKAEAIEKGQPFDDNIPAIEFEQDYDKAFMKAVESPKAIPADVHIATAEKLKASTNKPAEPVAEATTTEATTTEAKAPTAAELVKMAKEAVGRTIEETPAITGETANDNSEEIEPLSTTGVSVTTEENPESDTPAKEAPQTEEAPVQTDASNDPSKWAVDTNGGLVRWPGESNKKYNNRKHKFKLYKKAQTTVQTPSEINKSLPLEAETIGRNDPPSAPNGERFLTEEETIWWANRGGVIPSSVPVDWSIEAHEKHIITVDAMTSAAESAEVFSAAAALEESRDEPVTEQPNNEPATTTPAEEPVPPAKPTLTVASTTEESPELIANAQKFYGDTWTPERSAKLTIAFKWLTKAIEVQLAIKNKTFVQVGKIDGPRRIEMAMDAAIRNEVEALNIGAAVAKAA